MFDGGNTISLSYFGTNSQGVSLNLSGTAYYNAALDFIQNPPSDCEVIQLCPPTRLKSKRDSKNVDILKADYNLGQRVAENYLSNLEN